MDAASDEDSTSSFSSVSICAMESHLNSSITLTGVLGVDTFQIPVPGGDCSIVLLVDNPPARARTVNETDASYYHNQPPSNSQDCRGTVLRAILIDGGHDGAKGGGYKGKNASQLIKQTINIIESQYNLAVFDSHGHAIRTFTLTFDGWVITHWDRDHYCGALYLLWEASLEAGNLKCPYIKYDGQGNGMTTLYCPTWIDSPIPNSTNKTARGHHPMFGSNDTGRWGIALPPQKVNNRANNPLNYTKEEYDELGQSTGGCSLPFGSIVYGYENLLGLDLFTNILFNSDIPRLQSSAPAAQTTRLGRSIAFTASAMTSTVSLATVTSNLPTGYQASISLLKGQNGLSCSALEPWAMFWAAILYPSRHTLLGIITLP